MTSPIPTSFPLEDLIVANLYRLLMVDDQGQAVPLSANMLTGGGGASVSASEATQQQILSAVQSLAPLLGNTDGLETLAATNRDLLNNLGAYTDGLENLLTLLNTNTDGIEALLSALGVNDQNVIGKLEALRVLAESTNTHMQAANGNTFILANQAQNGGVQVRPAADAWVPAAPLDIAFSASTSRPLENPHGAALRSATVHVVGGALCRNIGADANANCPRLNAGDSERLTAAQYAAYRVLRASEGSVSLHVEFEVQP